MKYKEFFEKIQLPQDRQHMGQQAEYLLYNRYNNLVNRTHPLDRPENFPQSFEDFKKLRTEQMHKLHEAYTQLSHGQYHALMGPHSEYDNSIEAVRRVTGPNGLYNTGFVALDQTDITIISAITTQTHLRSSLPSYALRSVVDGIEAVQSFAEQQNDGQYIDIYKILEGSNVLKTEIAKADQAYDEHTFGEYVRYHPQPKGLLSKISNAFKKLVNPENFKDEQERFDNQDVPGLE